MSFQLQSLVSMVHNPNSALCNTWTWLLKTMLCKTSIKKGSVSGAIGRARVSQLVDVRNKVGAPTAQSSRACKIT